VSLTAWREARDPTYALFLLTVAVTLIRAPNQPSVAVSAGGTTLSITPADVLLLVLLVVVAVQIARGLRPARASAIVLVAAGCFGGWLLLSAIPNGATAFVAAGKLVEVGVLTLAAAVLVDRPERLNALLLVILAMVVAAAGIATIGGLQDPGRRQESFLGEHSLALVSTYALVLALVAIVGGRAGFGRLVIVAGVFGSAGIVFGASFSGLLGLYMVAVATLGIAWTRSTLTLRRAAALILLCAGITGGALMLRTDNLGFLRDWFGSTQTAQPGSTAGSWSSRLIYAYVGGRIFLDHPVLGTGWYGELPPKEYAQYLPDAHARFPDQPPNYFPQADATYIPQQTFDQVLYELGLVGAALLLALGVVTLRAAVRARRRWPLSAAEDLVAYVPITWLLAAVGGLAGTALFGGTPLAALFWLAVGLAPAAPALAEHPS